MSKKPLLTISVVSALGIAILAVGLPVVYAHCGKCLTDAKYFAGVLDKTKMTLAAASSIAEVDTKGTAVHATALRVENGANVEVHCLVEGQIMAILVDGQTGKVLKKQQVKDLEGHVE